MANCKDCLCVDVCKMRSDIVSADYYPEILKKKFEEECNCPHFKDRTRFVELPCKVKDLIDKFIGHNEIVGIWEWRKGKEGGYHILLCRGEAWNIPKEYLDRTALKIFGIIPESINRADTVNISVTPMLKAKAEKALEEQDNENRIVE